MFTTLAEVRAANARIGNNWFSKETMKFWKTKLESDLIRGKYFISSEDEWAMDGRKPARIYAVREALEDASIKTVRSHIRTLEEARDYVQGLK